METLDRCPICTHQGSIPALAVMDHSISKETFSLQDCIACGFRFTNPRPSSNELGPYYDDESYISHSNADRGFQNSLYQLARKWAIGRKYVAIARFAREGKILDIGCGTGEFLAHLMSRGFQVMGVEPSLRAREQSIANHGIQVLPSLEKIAAQEQFRVITMWHVLEHVEDLRSFFKSLYALLEPNGLLVIAVPDRESWDAHHYRSNWAAWDVPRHLSHFRRKDVQRLLREHGFEPVSINGMPLDAFYIALLSEQYRASRVPWSYLKALCIGAWSNMIGTFTKRPFSSTLFIARKPGA